MPQVGPVSDLLQHVSQRLQQQQGPLSGFKLIVSQGEESPHFPLRVGQGSSAPAKASPRKRKFGLPSTPPAAAPSSVLHATDIFHVGHDGDAPPAIVNPRDPPMRPLPTPIITRAEASLGGTPREGTRGGQALDPHRMQTAWTPSNMPGSSTLGPFGMTDWGQMAQRMGQVAHQGPLPYKGPGALQRPRRLPPVPPPPRADHTGGMSLGDMGLRSSVRGGSSRSNKGVDVAQTRLAEAHPLAKSQSLLTPPRVGLSSASLQRAGQSGFRSLPSAVNELLAPFRASVTAPSHSLPNLETAGLRPFLQGRAHGHHSQPPPTSVRPATPGGVGGLTPLPCSASHSAPPTMSNQGPDHARPFLGTQPKPWYALGDPSGDAGGDTHWASPPIHQQQQQLPQQPPSLGLQEWMQWVRSGASTRGLEGQSGAFGHWIGSQVPGQATQPLQSPLDLLQQGLHGPPDQ